MTDLKDKRKRQELIRRYLNAETTIEEERLLQNFLEHHEEELTPEEEDLRLIIISTTHLASDTEVSDDKVAEFDQMMEGETAVGKTNKMRSRILWPSTMVAALTLALVLLTKGTIKDTPVSQQYAKTISKMTPSPLLTRLEDKPQQKEEAKFLMTLNEDSVSQEPTTLTYDKEKQETDMPVSGENKPKAVAVEASETEMPDATPTVTTTRFAIHEPKDKRYPQNVTTANYDGGNKGYNHFVSSGNITIFTNTKLNGNVSRHAVVNTENGVRVLYPETQDDSIIYIIDGIRVTKETANRISPDCIMEMRRLRQGTSEAIKEDPDGQTHDIMLITTKKSDTDEQNHSLVPPRNGLLVFDNERNNGICLL